MILVKNEDINVTFLKVSDVYFGLGMPFLAQNGHFWPKYMGENSKNYQRCFTKPGIGLKMILVKNEDINVTILKVLDVYFGLGICVFGPKCPFLAKIHGRKF